MSKDLSIADAKRLAKELGDPGVIILSFHGDGQYSVVSYGANRRKCTAMGQVLDQIHTRLTHRDINVPADFYD